ncbi:hypothetical protein MSG28_012215 [Choristoneura fumiferana]|uniref:Uncharacterized protein n=1 Tax=Choristoneura fumiferana TaxID=7141 RepID=A0ACC0KCP2_CHOFU|nr:hypothetical protein MSG28_012215 [Choristoneura fumiferana]
MVMEADPIAEKHTDERVLGQTLRPRAGGDVIPERSVSSLDLTMPYSAPSNLVLTPAPECKTFIEKDLLETATLVTLESSSILNWWRQGRVPGAPRLLPLATSGDGNCLPHAASLAAYGFHDRLLALRTKVQALLCGEGGDVLTNAVKRRWRWSESVSLRSAGLTPTEAEWEADWEDAVRAASAEPRPRPAPTAAPHYSGLEQLHVFALAHVMRRPVIVFADVALRDFRGDPIAPIPFGGIYLPLEFNVDPGEDFCWDTEPEQKTINNLLPDENQRAAMLYAYLDLERVECLSQSQPPEELRRSLDALSTKSSKQLNSVAKQFGSIGRSMSSKLKKNFGSMAKLTGKSGSQSNPEESLMRRHYTAEKNRKEQTGPSQPRYGTGRSQFYAEADRTSHEVARGLANKPTKSAQDRTLYLSKSTFYDDRPPSPKPCKAPLCMYYGSPANNDYCSRCARLQ